ncbi:hypothetical protein DFH28DRAFT_1089887 [Melampsora americana]|nr:hypothetical protein DFH28DRAFT_1089887 [Melampsora americana]
MRYTNEQSSIRQDDTANDVPPTPTPSGKLKADAPDVDEEKSDTDNEEYVFKNLHFSKITRENTVEAPMTATQAVREVKLNQARSQYIEVKELYRKTKEGVDALEAKAAEGAVDKALHLSQVFLRELEETMKEDEQRLLEALSSAHPDVVFVPTSIESFKTTHVTTGDTLKSNTQPTGHKRKASTTSGGPSKRPRDVNVTQYLDLEAKESNRESVAEVVGAPPSTRGRIKSRAIVTESDDEWAAGGMLESKGDKQKAKDTTEEEKVKDEETMEEDAKSIFHVEKPDVSKIVLDTTEHEAAEVKQIRDSMVNSQFNWGDVLTVNVCNIIRSWCYDAASTKDKPTSESLTPHLMYIRSLVDDKDMMLLRLQTLKSHISAGYAILHNILADALKIVAFKNDHSNIQIRQEGEDGIAAPMVEQAKTMSWLARQCFAGDDDSGPKRGRIANATVRSIQKKYFHVLLGVNIVFESEIHNGLYRKAEAKGSTVRHLRAMKASQKSESVLYQLINDRNKHSSARLKSIAGSKASKQIASTSTAPSQPSKSSDKDKHLAAQSLRDVADFKKECLQYLSLFLMYGTAAFFHVWPAYREQTMPESATLIQLASLLCDRRFDRCGDEQHVFGARAWNRLDQLMFDSLKMFITDAGTFKRDIKWSEMTRHFYLNFDVKKLAGLYMLDILTETHRPGLSVGINGLVMDQIELKDDQLVKLNDPTSQTFRSMWGPTEGPLHPVADRGAGLYPEVDKHGRITRPHNPQTRYAADMAKSKKKDKGDLPDVMDENDVEEEGSEEEDNA